MSFLSSFHTPVTVVIIGATGGIGRAFIEHLKEDKHLAKLYAFSRSGASFDHEKIISEKLDFYNENSIKSAATLASENGNIHLIINATGLLHGQDIQPEKALKELDLENFQKVFTANAFGPAMIMKHFLPHIPKDGKSVFAALCGRVGSIEDNHKGGWYAYRASKAALNMLIRTTSIEIGRKHKEACIVTLHPGTVDTELSEPFQSYVKDGHLFTPEYSTEQLLNVINNLTVKDSGYQLAYDGETIPY